MDYAKLDALIEARRDEFLKDLGRWLSIPSVQGAAEEGAASARRSPGSAGKGGAVRSHGRWFLRRGEERGPRTNWAS